MRISYEQLAVTIEAFVQKYGMEVETRGTAVEGTGGIITLTGWRCIDRRSKVQIAMEGTAEITAEDCVKLLLSVDHCRRCAT